MKKTDKNIEIVTGNFFSAWMFALAFVFIVGGVSAVFYQILFFYKLGAYFWLTGSIIFSTIVWFSKKFFEFNPDTKQCRKGFYLFGFKLGEWEPLEIGRAYVAFQRYDENVHFTYGGLFNKSIKDTIFELRLVYPNSTFRTLVSGRDFQSVAMMLQLGKILGLVYNVEFKDFVKRTVQKEIKKQPLLWDERSKT